MQQRNHSDILQKASKCKKLGQLVVKVYPYHLLRESVDPCSGRRSMPVKDVFKRPGMAALLELHGPERITFRYDGGPHEHETDGQKWIRSFTEGVAPAVVLPRNEETGDAGGMHNREGVAFGPPQVDG